MSDRPHPTGRPHPLDLTGPYPYLERANPAVVELVEAAAGGAATVRVLDLGCGAGALGRVLRRRHAGWTLHGVEPSPAARRLAGDVYDRVDASTLADWDPGDAAFDVVVLSDVLEHLADPLGTLKRLRALPGLATARWVVSVPNYAVWYNRLRTLAGVFDYADSGLYDRSHLRFFTRASFLRLLAAADLEPERVTSTPAIVQSMAPLLRRLFADDVAAGRHLALSRSPLYRAYQRAVEPLERRACDRWPELLAFQIVVLAR